MNNKKVFKYLVASILVSSISLGLALTISKNGYNVFALDCDHQLNHYEELAPTEITAGHIEYWVCCKCHKSYYDEHAVNEVPNVTSDILNPSDGRYIAPTMNLIDSNTQTIGSWGTWNFNGSNGTVNNVERPWNDHLTFSPAATSSQDLEYAADISISSGFIHLSCGIDNPSDPGQGWYGLMINSDADTIAFGGQGKGDIIQNDFNPRKLTLPYGATSEKHTYRIIAKANGEFFAYVDETLVCQTYDRTYAGGYIGLVTWNGTATFENVRYKITSAAASDFVIPELTNYRSNDYRTNYNWGNWDWNNTTYSVSGNNIDLGNVFSMSSIYQKDNQDLVIEADVNQYNNCAAIVFGVSAINDPGAGWYSYQISGESAFAKLCSENKGTIGINDTTSRVTLSGSQLPNDKNAVVHVKIQAKANGEISCWLDNVFIATLTDTTFSGGYIGFLTFFSTVTFSNMKVQLTNVA